MQAGFKTAVSCNAGNIAAVPVIDVRTVLPELQDRGMSRLAVQINRCNTAAVKAGRIESGNIRVLRQHFLYDKIGI